MTGDGAQMTYFKAGLDRVEAAILADDIISALETTDYINPSFHS
jgi:hypothetical protein